MEVILFISIDSIKINFKGKFHVKVLGIKMCCHLLHKKQHLSRKKVKILELSRDQTFPRRLFIQVTNTEPLSAFKNNVTSTFQLRSKY